MWEFNDRDESVIEEAVFGKDKHPDAKAEVREGFILVVWEYLTITGKFA